MSAQPKPASVTVPRIPVYVPYLTGKERDYVCEAIESTWISSRGAFLDRFEAGIRKITTSPYAFAVNNGTTAIHLLLHALDIGVGDEVIVPTFTYIASVNTIAQTGATPVFAESLPDTWLVDPQDVKARITPRTKAIMAVHLYGMVCDMDALQSVANEAGIPLIEDSAEAFGSTYKGRQAGAIGLAGTYSFFGNKTITTGEGGAVVVQDKALADKIRVLRNQGMSETRRYWHEVLGFNYRMTNPTAAVGVAQLEKLDWIVGRKRTIAARYRQNLASESVTFQRTPEDVFSTEWLVSLLLPAGLNREAIMDAMLEQGIETRPVFYPAHTMPMYVHLAPASSAFPVASEISSRGLSLPSYPDMTDQDVDDVVDALKTALKLAR
jgi:perosamine synthetase